MPSLLIDTSLEARALAFGADDAKVEQRLRLAVKLLLPEYRGHFRKAAYSALTRSLVGDTERYYLRWSLRDHPDRPIGYCNQQCSEGTVHLYVLGAWEVDPDGAQR